MKVKIFSLSLVAMCAVLFLCGCGNNDGVWYPIEGGFINLKNVTSIRTYFSLELLKSSKDNKGPSCEGVISKENIDKARKLVENIDFDSVEYTAYIMFDNQRIKLQEMKKFRNKEDVLDMLDAWLDSVEELEDFIP